MGSKLHQSLLIDVCILTTGRAAHDQAPQNQTSKIPTRRGTLRHQFAGDTPTLREKLIKIGAKVVRHARYVTFQMAEVAMPRELFAAILERIGWFGVPPPLVQRG